MQTWHRKAVAWLAWSLCVACVGLALCTPLLSFLNGRTLVAFFRERDAAVSVLVISFSVVGALIVSHRPQNLIGWIFCAAALFQAFSAVGVEYGTYALVTRPGTLPFAEGVSWLADWIWAPGLGLILVFLPLLFPNGQPPSRRWWPVAWLGGLSIGMITASVSLLVWLQGDIGTADGPPGWLLALLQVCFPLMLLAGLLAVISLVLRFLGARGDERQQIKWFASAATLTFTWILLFEQLLGPQEGAFEAIVALSGLVVVPSIPIATGIAILRYRLYDIDRIVNRALVYAALTVTLVLVYLGGVISLQYAFRTMTGGESQVAVVASTLAIAALFNPLRWRIQALVDRRFYRRKYDAQKTLAAFSSRLREETDLDALGGELVTVVRETVQPASVALWLRPHDGARKGRT
ncbi:MAG TPA: hypothetical protein VNB93_01225 [Rubrobacter sp.]|nr:hypothetical protein [Rubrobacter sp.]